MDSLSTRMSDYYNYLPNNAPTFVAFNKEKYKTLADRAALPLTAEQMGNIIQLGGPLNSIGFDTVCPTTFSFPKDNGPHFAFSNEWYYLACNLKTHTGKDIAIVCSVVRQAVVPSCFQDDSNKLTKSYDIVKIVLAITIPEDNFHSNYTNTIFGTDESVIFQAAPFKWNAGIITMESTSKEDVFPLKFTAKDTENNIDISLEMTVDNDPAYFLEGDKGCSPCISGIGSMYYSFALINCEGSVVHDSKVYTIDKTSKAWLDHQWVSRFLPGSFPSSTFLRLLVNTQAAPDITPRWNWLFYHLDDGTAITLAILPAPAAEAGKTMSITNVTYISADLSTKTVHNTGKLTYVDTYTSPHTGTIYPGTVKLELPYWDLDVTMTPIYPDQEIGGSGSQLYEGGGTVSGTKNGKPISGSGFLEFFGNPSNEQVINGAVKNLELPLTESEKDMFLPINGNATTSWILILLPVVLALAVIVLIIMSIVLLVQHKSVHIAYIGTMFGLIGFGFITSITLANV